MSGEGGLNWRAKLNANMKVGAIIKRQGEGKQEGNTQ